MIYQYFAVEKVNEITMEDLSNLREFYGPFLGADPVFLYQYLLDIVKDSNYKRSSYDFLTLTTFLNMHENRLNQARLQLEAVGLIDTLRDDEQKITIFSIQKPLNAAGIKNNHLISEMLKSKIGETYFKIKVNNKLKKSNIIETPHILDVSANFFDVFSNENEKIQYPKNEFVDNLINLGKLRQQNSDFAPVDFSILEPINLLNEYKYSNKYEALIKLSTKEFYKLISYGFRNEKIENILDEWISKFTDQKIINYVLYISKEKSSNSNEWFKHANSMMVEIKNAGLVKFDTIETYFDGKFKDPKEQKIFHEKEAFKNALKH
ncbi:hypothetical protein U5U50_02105 [Mycoplasma sp. 888]|uniref:hypothetical protein n=1 Tax=Mycoplasma sp. 888 TaxID=3108483 RepID=UPI002D76E6FE|nr:hypothetical protein [Mycoplasma sp. 888]WRQ25585.1 hypothetical protein U5U50_02105 [Mycoplasma sp. 888]